jgi:hypothetical protein
MIALVIVSTFVVLLLGILVAGLLRSHADILRSLHELGAGVGDPAADTLTALGVTHQDTSVPDGSGSDVVPDIAGLTPEGDARAISVTISDQPTLLAFLSSGCATCAGFWRELQMPGHLGLGDVRIAIVTKGPDMESPAEVRALSAGRVPVVMSTEAWKDYRVPASPFFVLVDGRTGRRVGHGVAAHPTQLADLVKRAGHDVSLHDPHLDGPAREAANDAILVAAGITPGHRSLYPQSFRDVFPFAPAPQPSPDDTGERTERAG